MPQKISRQEFERLSPAHRRRSKLEWPDEWFDGEPRKFIRSEDFPTMHAPSFQLALRVEAQKRGLTMKTSRIDSETVMAYAVKNGEHE